MEALADLDLGTIGGAMAVAVALLQLALRARLDLGGATLAVVGVTWVLATVPGTLGAGLLAVALAVAALAWWRAAERGVGRPELDGLVAVALLQGQLAVAVLPGLGVAADGVRGAAAGAIALAGVVSVLLARERRGLRGQRTYHWREVPVERVGDPATGAREAG